MAHTITGKLNKNANIFQAGDSTGFGIRLGVKYRDPKTKQDAWTNYQAAIFAKSPAQVQFYQSALVEGSIIEVSAEQLSVESFDGNNGPVLSINMLNARLGYVHTAQGAPKQQAAPQQQYQQQAAPQGVYQQQAAPPQQHSGFNQQPNPANHGQQAPNFNEPSF